MTGHRCLVTGASGLVGGATVRSLLARPDVERVIATSRREADDLKQLQREAGGRLVCVPGVDLTDPEQVFTLPGEYTHAIHAAALARFEGASPYALHRANVFATELLLDHLVEASKDSLQRFVYVSTIGVHDRPRRGSCERSIDETSPCAPTSSYGRSKLSGEERVRRRGLPFAIARLGWIYGASMRKDSHARVFAELCLRQHPVSQLDLPGRVMLADVDDTASALAALALRPGLSHDTYLVAHAEPISVGAIFSVFHELCGRPGRPRVPVPAGLCPAPLRRLLPMKVRTIVEDYLVCRVDRLEREGISLDTGHEIGLQRAASTGRWFGGS